VCVCPLVYTYTTTKPLFFHKATKFLQAFVLMHDEGFQALAVYEDILLFKPFLDIFVGNITCKLPTLEIFSSIVLTWKSKGPK
jgi:hypothetical protein